MNNPLAVISGRSQLLSMTLDQGSKEQKAAQLVFQESHKLSSLITSLRLIADPPIPNRTETDLHTLLEDTVNQFVSSATKRDKAMTFSLKVVDTLPPISLDPEQIHGTLRELIFNAVHAKPRSGVQVRAQLEPGGGAVVVQVIDDGEGWTPTRLNTRWTRSSGPAKGRRPACGDGPVPRQAVVIGPRRAVGVTQPEGRRNRRDFLSATRFASRMNR